MRPLGIRKVAGITAAAVALSTLGGFAELTGETGRAEAAAAQAVAAPAVGPSLAAHAAPSVVVAPADWAARDGRETRDTPEAISASRLSARIAATLGPRSSTVSVVVHDRRTGQVVTHNPSLRNSTGSIVKVMILVALIHERRSAGRGPSGDDWNRARAMITVSDNDAASTLLARAGGRRSLDRLASRLGMRHTSSASSWGRTSTSAADQVKLMDAILDGRAVPNAADRRRVLDLMSNVVPEQAWGVGAVPAAATVQLKNGWVSLSPYGWRINGIGHVAGQGRNYTIAMLSYRSSWPGGTAVLGRVSRVVYDGIDDLPPTARTQVESDADASVPTSSPDALTEPLRSAAPVNPPASEPAEAAESPSPDSASQTSRPAGEGTGSARGAISGSLRLPGSAPEWFGAPGAPFRPYPVW